MRRRQLATLALASWSAQSRAACGPPLHAPMNALGALSYMSSAGPAGSVPRLLRELARRSGCTLALDIVPRARLVQMFVAGQKADLIFGTRAPGLEKRAEFVALARIRPSLIVEQRLADRAPATLAELAERGSWRGLYVRGAGANEQVLAFNARMEARQRMLLVRDWSTVLRMLLAERAEFTLFSPSLLHGETALMQGKSGARLRSLPLADLLPYEVGTLLSLRLPAATRTLLRQHLETMARDGSVRRALEADHPAALVRQDFQFFD